MRVFLDANILFSAAKSDGAVRLLLDLLLEAGHDCCVDGYVVEEARRNLAAKAPHGVAALEAMASRFHRSGFQHADRALEATLPLPAKDQPVLAAAIRHGCGALVTGDRSHFGALYGKTFSGVKIHSPRSLAEALFSAPRIRQPAAARYLPGSGLDINTVSAYSRAPWVRRQRKPGSPPPRGRQKR